MPLAGVTLAAVTDAVIEWQVLQQQVRRVEGAFCFEADL